jgi:HEAT repeat protein
MFSFKRGKPDIEKLVRDGDVRGLIKAMNYRKDRVIRKQAVEALREIGGEDAVEALITAFRSDNDIKNDIDMRSAFIATIVAIESHKTDAFLSELTDHYAAIILFDERSAGFLDKRSAEINVTEAYKQHALEALKLIGAHAVKHLLAVARTPDADPQIGFANQGISLRALGILKPREAVPDLIEILENAALNEWVREEAARALGNIRDERAVDPLIAVLGNEHLDEDVREAAAEALGQLGDARAVNALLSALKYRGDDDWRNYTNWGLHAKAAQAIGNLQDERAFEPLLELLHEPDVYEWELQHNVVQAGDARIIL